jgi:tetratricopeptide (TPR) repeat protein
LASLKLKQSQRGEVGSGPVASDEAATLYQLAIVATISRPPRLDEAEKLLLRVLDLGSDGGATRAATLQQLGRVALRRGELDIAETYFRLALAGYQEAYGADPHINLSAVQLRLGNVAMTRRRYLEADEHLQEALRIRLHVYGQSAHSDVAVTLHLLGLNDRAQGSFDSARQHFERELVVLNQLLLSDKGSPRIPHMIRDVLVSLRQTAKDSGDRDQYSTYSSQLKELKQSDDDLIPSRAGTAHSESFAKRVALVLELRSQVRKELQLAVKEKRSVPADILLNFVASLKRATTSIPPSCAAERQGWAAITLFSDELAEEHKGINFLSAGVRHQATHECLPLPALDHRRAHS